MVENYLILLKSESLIEKVIESHWIDKDAKEDQVEDDMAAFENREQFS